MTSTPPHTTPVSASDKTHPRTEVALERLRKAMRDIEADIAANQGIYPFNYGRVTHKDTTRVEIMGWLDALSSQLTQTRDSTRERVTVVADNLAAELVRLTLANQAVEQRLADAEQRIAPLRQENERLRNRVTISL